jgi:lysophospholipase L1-like esterase
MYDGSDFLDNRVAESDEEALLPQSYNGAVTAGISLIQQTFPWIRIVLMSPTYAYALDEDGNYIDSESKIFGSNKLSAFVYGGYDAALSLNVSFTDCYYGGIYEDNAAEYLLDQIHLNEKGKDLLAQRMEDALQKSLEKQN